MELQEFAHVCGLNIDVSHFPPGTGKWNKIEYRMFGSIAMNWRRKLLTSVEVIVNLMANTSTDTGLTIRAEASTREISNGKKGVP